MKIKVNLLDPQTLRLNITYKGISIEKKKINRKLHSTD